jgi:hypothetical protein
MLGYDSANEWRWDFDTKEVRFWTRVPRPVLCRVAWEWISDNCGAPEQNDVLTVAQTHSDGITDKIGRKIFAGYFEADGSVLLK